MFVVLRWAVLMALVECEAIVHQTVGTLARYLYLHAEMRIESAMCCRDASRNRRSPQLDAHMYVCVNPDDIAQLNEASSMKSAERSVRLCARDSGPLDKRK